MRPRIDTSAWVNSACFDIRDVFGGAFFAGCGFFFDDDDDCFGFFFGAIGTLYDDAGPVGDDGTGAAGDGGDRVCGSLSDDRAEGRRDRAGGRSRANDDGRRAGSWRARTRVWHRRWSLSHWGR